MRKSLREAVHLTEQCLGGNCSPTLSFCARVVRCESGISAIEKWTPSDLRQRRQVSHVRVIATPLTFCSRVDQDERLRECLLEVSCCRRSFFLSFFFLLPRSSYARKVPPKVDCGSRVRFRSSRPSFFFCVFECLDGRKNRS